MKFWEELILLLSTFPTCHLFEVLEPNVVELNISELTLISFNSIHLNLTEFTAVKIWLPWLPWNMNNKTTV
jgi:hypothetical protein